MSPSRPRSELVRPLPHRRPASSGRVAAAIACGVMAGLHASASHAADGHDATGVEYVVKDSINGGEPIRLEYWEFSGQRADYQREWVEAYREHYPNVEIEIVLQPWETYWPALITNVPAGSGPAMWHMHTSQLSEFCAGDLMEPIPESVADRDHLEAHWIGFAEGALSCPGTGSIHTVPMGAMLPLLFINDEKWAAAGLGDDDVPGTWEELREVASTLTEKDGRGRISVGGLSFDGQEWLQNAVYQQGRYLFSEDGTAVQVANPEYEAALGFLGDIVHEDGSLDQEVAGTRFEGFAAGKAAMYIGFSWIAGYLDNNAPDMSWSAAPLPTPDGDNEPAYGNVRFAVEAVVNPYASDAEKAVAWDFWHFNYANERTVLRDLALANGFLPPYDALLDAPEVASDKVVSVIAPASEYGVINDLPEFIRAEQLELVTSVMLEPGELGERLERSERTQNALLSKGGQQNIIERRYAHDDLMLQD